MRDAADNARNDAPVVRRFGRPGYGTEPERIHHGDGTRAHRENVAQDSADAGGRALKRLDVARVVVRLDLESDHPTAADADDAGIFARPLHHVLARRRQLFQMDARTLIGAVLAPHNAENAQFGVGRLAAEKSHDLVVLRDGELMLRDQLGCDFHESTGTAVGIDASIDSKTPIPSVEPINGSQARSGCGIMPITLRSRLRIPAIERAEPFGFST